MQCQGEALVLRPGTGPTERVTALVEKCRTMKDLQKVHCFMLKNNLLHYRDAHLGKIIGLCVELKTMACAHKLFEEMPSRKEPYLWNLMIRGYALNDGNAASMAMYLAMLQERVVPNKFTFPPLLKACAKSCKLREGKQIHAHIMKSGLSLAAFIAEGLIEMYMDCGVVDDAHRIFGKMSKRSVVSWNMMLNGYAELGELKGACKMFDEMPIKDLVSWNSMITAYMNSGRPDMARKIFDEMPAKNGWSWNAMISGYTKLDDLQEARAFFDQMIDKNTVSWNAMIDGYAKHGRYEEAIQLFRQMLLEAKPNENTLVSALAACAHLGSLDTGKWIHDYLVGRSNERSLLLNNVLIDMYAKCGDIDKACAIFNDTRRRDIFTWNSMILGLAMHGLGREALQLFSDMQAEGIQPDDISFIAALYACSHAGLIEEGKHYFNDMSKIYNLNPKIEHFGCMVDLFGRAGHIEEACNLIKGMPFEPNSHIWIALLNACRIHGNVELGEEIASNVKKEALDGRYQVLLSNIYAADGRWNNVALIRKNLKEDCIHKPPGWSSVEIDHAIHRFIAGDRSHPQSERIYLKLNQLLDDLKDEGYVPHTKSALHGLQEEEKEKALYYHSEKIAVAFALLSTDARAPIRIMKNLRVCHDCHFALKLISKITSRVIVVRDRSRFHHFINGQCSCADYW